MINLFKKSEQKFYKIETDSVCGNAVYYLIGRMLSTAHVKYFCDSEKGLITFLSTKTEKEILKKLNKTFGEIYDIESKGAVISMTPKMVKAL